MSYERKYLYVCICKIPINSLEEKRESFLGGGVFDTEKNSRVQLDVD
jgi:hypothetical protein